MNIPQSGIECVKSWEISRPHYKGDIDTLLSAYDGKIFRILDKTNELLLSLYDQSKFNGIDLGWFTSFRIEDNGVVGVTEEGDSCGKNDRWKLKLRLECDNSIEMDTIQVSSLSQEDNCTVSCYANTMHLCSHVKLGKENVISIRCATKPETRKHKRK